MGIDIGKEIETIIVTVSAVRNGSQPSVLNPNGTYYLSPVAEAEYIGSSDNFDVRFFFASNGPYAGNWVLQILSKFGLGDEAFLGYSDGDSVGTFCMVNINTWEQLLWYSGYATCAPRYTTDPEAELNTYLDTLGLPTDGKKLIELTGTTAGKPVVRLAEKKTHTCCYIKIT